MVLLPIPPLEGGVLFCLYCAVSVGSAFFLKHVVHTAIAERRLIGYLVHYVGRGILYVTQPM